MTITINVNGLTLCHRGSGGISRNTLPDVCKTPSKGTPLPYSNISYSKDLAKGSTSVFADGGNMIANSGSIFAKSIGDEAGSMGGIKSGTHLAESEWMTHSFDVFIEKKAACRLTDKMFMNHRNTVNMAGLWQLQLEPQLAQKICDAICACNGVTNLLPTSTQVAELAGDVMDVVRGVEDQTSERPSARNETHRRQACFVKHFADGNPWYGSTPKDSKVLIEVPFKIPTDVIMSESDRTTYPGGPSAPGSVLRALNQARGNPGTVVIWDMVTLKDGSLPASWDNIEKIIEVKFRGDRWTENQEEARSRPAVARKLVRVDEADCACGQEDRERQRKTNEIVKKIGESMKKVAPLFGPPGLPGMKPAPF